MKRQPVGITGRLWRKVSDDEREAYKRLAEEGFSFRDIAKRYGRDHHTVSYNLKADKERFLLSDKQRNRRLEKKRKPIEHVRLMQKLNSCIQQARKRAEKKYISIDIDVKFLMKMYQQQEGFCALTGIKMEIHPLVGMRTNPYSVSLDRIDSNRGYTHNNVRLVVWCINWSLGEWGEDHFEEIAKTYLVKKYGRGLLTFITP